MRKVLSTKRKRAFRVPPSNTVSDPKRLAALDGYKILDSASEPGFDDIVQLAVQICEVPVALISFVAADRQWFKARIGFEGSETDLDRSVCAFVLDEPDLLVIPDLSQDERTRTNPLVAGEPGIRFYAGAPLRTATGETIGSLCAIDVRPRPSGLTAVQAIGMRSLARQVMTQLELRRTIGERDDAMALQSAIEELRRERDQQFRLLFQSIQDGFCIVEMRFEGGQPVDYRFIELNPSFERLTGLADARGKWMRDLAPNHEQHWFDLYGGVAMTGEPAYFQQHANELGERWYDVRAFRVGDPRARQVGILFQDATAAKIAEAVREQDEADQQVRNQELSHRMKNTLAMVQAIAVQTLRSVPDRAPVDAFTQRLHALSAAHDVLLQQSWVAAKLDSVVRAVLAATVPLDRLEISGPDVDLGPRATLSISLLLHELSTNAIKYGALSTDHGRITLTWELSADGKDLTLSWTEQGGPAAVQPSRKGFGSRLIQLGLVGTGGAELRYLPSGLEAEFKASIDHLRSA